MTTGIRSNADGSKSYIAVGGTDRVTIGSQGIEAGSLAPGSVTPTELSQKLTAHTAVAASGTAIDFTGIPSWVQRITVMFSGVSTSGTSVLLIRLGTSGGVEATGYNGNISGGPTSGYYVTGETIGFPASYTTLRTAATIFSGAVQFVLLGTNTWTVSGVLAPSTSVAASLAGDKTLSGTLGRVRITTVNGTDTFDAGTINIMWE